MRRSALASAEVRCGGFIERSLERSHSQHTFFHESLNPTPPSPFAASPHRLASVAIIQRTANDVPALSTRHGLAHHLAVMNVGRQLHSMDDPRISEFAAATPPVNALAKTTPGIVWSFDNDDPAVHLTVPELSEDDLLIPQLSVWKDVGSLRHFTFKSGHAMYYKRRREWFAEMPAPYSVLWWHSTDALASMADAFERLRHLRNHGPSDFAFTFKSAKHRIPRLATEAILDGATASPCILAAHA